jgi:hypothetical protein
MKNQKPLMLGVFTAIVFTCLQTFALGQTVGQSTDVKVANVRAEGMAVKFDSAISYSSATLTVSGPDGTVYRREFGGGSVPSLALFDKTGAALGNGQYIYELRFTTVQWRDLKQSLAAAPDDGVMDENGRTSRGRLSVQSVVQSGSFALQNGTLYVGNETEPTSRPTLSPKSFDKNPQRAPGVLSGNTLNRLRNHRLSLFSMPDIVQPDDVIVQGSECVGLDCVNGEAFGFDTIRLKENNDRLQFDDTSTAAGFASNNWQIRANGSGSGGANFLGFVDQGLTGNSETGTIVFSVAAGAPANSLNVSSTGKVGLRTATPVLDVHANTGDTPAIRFEQNSGGGFTAQTWDVAGNEANFFVRDVTGGSRLPFRIRPGAPTSSVDISATGNVGIGNASPSLKLHAIGTSGLPAASGTTQNGALRIGGSGGTAVLDIGDDASNTGDAFLQVTNSANLAQTFPLLLNPNGGNVGIGTTAPDQKLSVNGDADKTGGNTWLAFSDERLKTIKGRFNLGLKAVMQLQPIRYEYLKNNALGLKSEGEHIGFGAQAVQKIIPEAVTKNSAGYLMVNGDPILWTMLNAIKEQQKEIVELKGQIRQLQSASHRRGNRLRR